jgi:hypothetical protein
MKRSLIYCCVVILALSAGSAFAQIGIPPGGSIFNPPPPAPPPPPKIEVPAIPKMDAVPRRSYVPTAPRKSYGDRITKCLDDTAGLGLTPSQREVYSRNCATR